MKRFLSLEYHITLPVPHKLMIAYIIQQNAFIETLSCSKSQISFEIENISLLVIPCVIKKQIIYFQNIMVQIKHYHSERKKWGDSKEILNQNKTGNQQSDTKSCHSCLMSKSLDDSATWAVQLTASISTLGWFHTRSVQISLTNDLSLWHLQYLRVSTVTKLYFHSFWWKPLGTS